MAESPIYAKARTVVFLGTGLADANHPPGEAPRVTHRVREIAPRSIFTAPPAELRRQIEKGRATAFEPEPGSKLAELLPAVIDVDSPAEAAEAGASIKGVSIWRAARGADGHWRPAPAATGLGPLTDAAFANLKAVRAHWANHPKVPPLFVLHEREGVRVWAWIDRALVEAFRH